MGGFAEICPVSWERNRRQAGMKTFLKNKEIWLDEIFFLNKYFWNCGETKIYLQLLNYKL